MAGICIKRILERAGILDALDIYIKRVCRLGIWLDEGRLQYPTVEEALRGEQYHDAAELHQEAIQCHYDYKPHARAALVFARVVED